MGSMRQLPSLQNELPEDVYFSESSMKEQEVVWQCRYKSKIIYMVTPRWFEARFAALSIFVAEREDIEIVQCKKGRDPQAMANRGYEVYHVYLGHESVIRMEGVLRIFPEGH